MPIPPTSPGLASPLRPGPAGQKEAGKQVRACDVERGGPAVGARGGGSGRRGRGLAPRDNPFISAQDAIYSLDRAWQGGRGL